MATPAAIALRRTIKEDVALAKSFVEKGLAQLRAESPTKLGMTRGGYDIVLGQLTRTKASLTAVLDQLES